MGIPELPSVSKIVCTIIVGAIPKLVVLILSAVVAATIADMYTGAEETPASICAVLDLRYGQRRDRAPRICFNGVATSIISVFTALTLIQVDLLLICAPIKSIKRLGHAFNLLVSFGMGVFWLITSALLADLYRDYCDKLDDRGDECTDTDERFIATPILGFCTLVGWGVITLISLIRVITG
ncbi:uncharacterized protein [Dysidea avara]|uniref:uncharacterized protein n=1 Tax=Dysidea avara TaxID=196820 RepID=UPI003330E439